MRPQVTFVRTDKRNYATANIVTYSKKHCQKGQILVLLDGDDQIIGRETLTLLSHTYTLGPPYPLVVYTNNLSNRLHWGGSKTPRVQFFQTEDRIPLHLVSPIRTYSYQLFQRVGEKDHRMDGGHGGFLDTFYDDGIQYPVLEMAGIQRVVYLPEICYYYVIDTGDNDNSTPQKIKHRNQVRDDILGRKRYKKLP